MRVSSIFVVMEDLLDDRIFTSLFMAITDDLCHITNTSVIQDDLGNAKGAAITFILFMTESFCWAGRQAHAAYGQKNKMGKPSVHHEVGAFGASSASACCDWSPLSVQACVFVVDQLHAPLLRCVSVGIII